jgi:hypothetical protein
MPKSGSMPRVGYDSIIESIIIKFPKYFVSRLSSENLSFSVSISGHLIALRNCRAICKLSPEGHLGLNANGPAIWGGCVTRRQHRAESWYFSCETVTVQGGYGTCFCHPGTNFIEHYACRGTSLISETDLSRCNKCYKMGTGAVSRYNLSRS